MKPDPIRVGDLVMLVRFPHKCPPIKDWRGIPFRVGRLYGSSRCAICGEEVIETSAGPEWPLAWPRSWLKRIPPLEELEGKRQKEDVPSPVTFEGFMKTVKQLVKEHAK